jgi:hypothetical protein
VTHAELANDYARGGYHAKHALEDVRHWKWLAWTTLQVGRHGWRRAFKELAGALAYFTLRLGRRYPWPPIAKVISLRRLVCPHTSKYMEPGT